VPSFVWERDTADAWLEPYEYGGQEQFQREAKKVISLLKDHYSQKDMQFNRDERSLEKALWLIQVDALEAISDALVLTEEKRHRIAARMFRDAVETMDTSAYFYLAKDKATTDLEKWYENEVIPHRKFRTFIRDYECKDKAKDLSELYRDLSKYTHRTHSAIMRSYILGRKNSIAYDGFSKGDFRVLPHVISFSYAVIAALIKRFITVAENTEQLSSSEAESIWKNSLEKKTVPRRFGTGPGQIMRGPLMEINLEEDES
jgi:hypothetical protein